MKPATYSFRWFLLVILAATCAIFSLLALSAEIELSTAWKDIAASSIILMLGIWISILSIYKYPTRAGLLSYAFLISIGLAIGTFYLDKFLVLWLYNHPPYEDWVISTQWVRLTLIVIAFCWATTHIAVRRKTIVLEQQFKELTDAATLHREAELYKLRQQLQPHFLYNSLNSINALILIDPDRAQEMIGKLSDFLRNSVRREGKESIPVAEELDYIEAYLAIEAVRFGDRLNIIYDKEFTDSATIPPFLLQPILENAIKFGLYGKSGAVAIHIHISLENGMLKIRITNPYEHGHRPPAGTGFGLEGIKRRLYLLFGRTDLLETSQEEGNFITTLNIPQSNA